MKDRREPTPPPAAQPAGGGDPAPGDGHLRYLITAYLFGDISEAGRAEVEGHLAECAECRKELEELRRTAALVEDALGAGGAVEAAHDEAGYDFDAQRAERVLEAARKRSAHRRRRFFLSAAAALTLGALGIAGASLFLKARRPLELASGRLPAPATAAESGTGSAALKARVAVETAAAAPAGAEAPVAESAGAAAPAEGESGPAALLGRTAREQPRDQLHVGGAPVDKPGRAASLDAARETPVDSDEDAVAEAQEEDAEALDEAVASATRAFGLAGGGRGAYGERYGPGSVEKKVRVKSAGEPAAGERDGSGAAAGAPAEARLAETGRAGRAPARRPLAPATAAPRQDAKRDTVASREAGVAAADRAGERGERGRRRLAVRSVPPPSSPAETRAMPRSGSEAALPPGASGGERKRELKEAGSPGKAAREARKTPRELELLEEKAEAEPESREGRPKELTGRLRALRPDGRLEAVSQERALEEPAYQVDLGAILDRIPENLKAARFPGGIRSPAAIAEPLLRAYAYYRALDPTLGFDAFAKRPIEIPPPEVGDEGLGREGFRARYGVNPFVLVERDRFSTFGLDVDTASWRRLRALLKAGRLPPPQEVRVEECINAFPDPRPADPDRVFTVFADGGPSLFGDGLDLLRLTIKTRNLRPNERKPAVITVACDTSGSMARENRLEIARAGLEALVQALEPADRIALVSFGGGARVVLPHTPARERAAILEAIRTLRPEGGTHFASGLELAYRLADEVRDPRAANRVLLVSDGGANVGARGPEAILERIEAYRHRRIYLSVIGCGRTKYDDALLRKLADSGNGTYTFAGSEEEARKLFRKAALPGELQVLAEDAKIQVEFHPEAVVRYRLLGYEKRDIADRDFRNDRVDAGEIGPGRTVTVLYEILRRPSAAGDLATVRLRYRLPESREIEEVTVPVPVGAIATNVEAMSPRLRLIACVAELAEILRGSYYARNGSIAKVLEVLHGLPDELKRRPEWKEVEETAGLALQASVRALASLAAGR